MNLEFLHAILENAGHALITCNERGEVIYSNEMAKQLSLSEETVLGYLHAIMRSEPLQNVEFVFWNRYYKVSGQRLLNPSKKLIGAAIAFQDITEAKIANDRLHSRFQAVFEQSPFSIQLLSKEGRTLRVNPAYIKLWGVSDELLKNYIYGSYNILEDKILEENGHLSYIKRGYAGEIVQVPPFFYDPKVLGLDGRARWAGGLVYPLKDAQGVVQEVVIIHHDVTDQFESNAEKEKLLRQLTTEHNRLSTILNRIPAGVMVVEAPDGKLGFKNERMIQMEAAPRDEISDYTDLTMHSSDGRKYNYQDFPGVRSLKNGEVITDEEMTVSHGNKKRIISVNAAPIYDSEGKIIASVIVNTDVTEKKKIESIQSFLDRVKSVLLTTLDIEETIGELAKCCVPFLADSCYVDLIEGNEVKRTITHPHETMPAEVIKLPLQIRGASFGSISFGMNSGRHFQEIDKLTCIEVGKHAALAIDNAKLYNSAKGAIQLRDDFISLASHELKTPLTSLNLQIEVLTNIIEEAVTQDNTYALKVMNNTSKQIKKLSRLVDDMLDISKITYGKFTLLKKEMDLSEIAKDVLDRFADQLENLGIKYAFYSHGPVMMKGDPYRMDQVVTNFLTNAIRYGNRSPIEVSVFLENEKAILKVRDYGKGIPKNDQERIFNRFERSEMSNMEPGLGLGLFINRQIIQEHGGTIWVESEVGCGSTFIAQL